MKNLSITRANGKILTGKMSGCMYAALLSSMMLSGCKKVESIAAEILQASKNVHKTSNANDFMIAVLPDTQCYSSLGSGANMKMWSEQMQWIKNNAADSNIVYVAHLGDLVNSAANADSNVYKNQFNRADTVFRNNLDNYNIPYGVAVGNHDQAPAYDATGGSTDRFQKYFVNQNIGVSRFAGKSFYGGDINPNKYESHYDLFSAGGYDWIVIYFEFDNDLGTNGTGQTNDIGRNDWAYDLMKNEYPNRKAIIVSHYVADHTAPGTPSPLSDQGSFIYNKLKTLPNLVMFLGGHKGDESGEPGFRSIVRSGMQSVRFYVSDYQFLTNDGTSSTSRNGGNGYMRLMKFSPSTNKVTVHTFSPYVRNRPTLADPDLENDSRNNFTKALF